MNKRIEGEAKIKKVERRGEKMREKSEEEIEIYYRSKENTYLKFHNDLNTNEKTKGKQMKE